MAAANTDKFIKGARRWTGQIGASGVADGSVTTIPLVSTTNLPTDTAVQITIDRVDANGNLTPSKEEVIRGTVSGSNIIDAVRGVEGTAQAHSAGAVVEVILTADQWERMIDALLAEHNQDGSHGDVDLGNSTDFNQEHNSDGTHKLTGWNPYSVVIPTRISADDPTYEIRFDGVDLSSILSEGCPVKWTQNGIVRYGFLNKDVVYSGGNSTVSILTRCDDASGNYDVLDTTTYPITNFNYAPPKSPGVGFPISPTKWTIETKSTADDGIPSPSSGAWNNPGSRKVDLAIGIWDLGYQAVLKSQVNGSAMVIYSTLSTANNSESDSDFTQRYQSNGAAASTFLVMGPVAKNKTVSISSKTSYYLNAKVAVSGASDITFQGGSGGTTIIRAICAYL